MLKKTINLIWKNYKNWVKWVNIIIYIINIIINIINITFRFYVSAKSKVFEPH